MVTQHKIINLFKMCGLFVMILSIICTEFRGSSVNFVDDSISCEDVRSSGGGALQEEVGPGEGVEVGSPAPLPISSRFSSFPCDQLPHAPIAIPSSPRQAMPPFNWKTA